MEPPPLTAPVSSVWNSPVGPNCMAVESAEVGNSVQAVASMMIDYGCPALPVVENGAAVGLVTEEAIVQHFARGGSDHDQVRDIMVAGAPTVSGRASGAEALRAMSGSGLPGLAVTDNHGRVIGVVTASRLVALTDRNARPKLVGGMATPFGVYLSTGSVSGGVNKWALVAAGATLFTSYLAGAYVVLAVSNFLPKSWLSHPAAPSLAHIAELLCFFVVLRLLPLAGFHAAEHKVVHAIEQHEPLERDTVSRMSRVHPRCGTNLAVGATLFLGISNTPLLPDPELRLLLAILATMFLFRPLGSFVQRTFTTKPPNQGQIDNGIKAGQALLRNYQVATNIQATPWNRIWNSGILQVMAGSMTTALLVAALFEVLRVPIAWRVV